VINKQAYGGNECDFVDFQYKTCNTHACPTPYPTTYPTTTPTTYPTPYPTAYPTTSPTTYPTPYPTTYPTSAPTAHHCDAGTHYCWRNKDTPTEGHAKCIKLTGDTYECECPTGYVEHSQHVSHESELKHKCEKTPAPTAYPTTSPTDYPTPYPTTNPTTYPTDYPTPYPTAYPTTEPTD
jgi:hypothetical protein